MCFPVCDLFECLAKVLSPRVVRVLLTAATLKGLSLGSRVSGWLQWLPDPTIGVALSFLLYALLPVQSSSYIAINSKHITTRLLSMFLLQALAYYLQAHYLTSLLLPPLASFLFLRSALLQANRLSSLIRESWSANLIALSVSSLLGILGYSGLPAIAAHLAGFVAAAYSHYPYFVGHTLLSAAYLQTAGAVPLSLFLVGTNLLKEPEQEKEQDQCWRQWNGLMASVAAGDLGRGGWLSLALVSLLLLRRGAKN